MECADIVKKNNSNLLGYACIIDRTNTNSMINENIYSLIKLDIKTFKENELPEKLKKIKPIKPGSRNSSK